MRLQVKLGSNMSPSQRKHRKEISRDVKLRYEMNGIKKEENTAKICQYKSTGNQKKEKGSYAH